MANGLPDEFPFNRRRYSHPGPDAPAEQVAQEEALDIELTAEEVEEVAQAAKAATILTAPLPASPVPAPALQRSPSMSYTAAPIVERRSAVRQTLIARATIKPESNYAGIGPSAAGYISNISLRGVGFHTRRPLIIGERYSIKLEVGPMRWATRLKVVTCEPHPGGTYDVGAEFVTNELQIRAPRDIAA
jgi:hypothetical protein